MKNSGLLILAIVLLSGCNGNLQKTGEGEIKAYNIDFNWGEGGPNGFAKPGLWADANPADHVNWYASLGCNVIQSFAVSCNGYAWYKNGIVPEQPGLKYDFLTDQVKLAHQKNIKVFGYFCAGSNTKWGLEHPDLSYGAPSSPHIPYTTKYLDYLCGSIEDAIIKTNIDGVFIDWLWNPGTTIEPYPHLVWMVFNTLIALMLMELDVFQALGKVLGLYSNIAISWMMAVVADLVINKPMGWSPAGIEFKRAHLYDINPVGVGAMGVASLLSITAYLGALGPLAQAFSALIALVTALAVSPLIAWWTQGRYYLARLPAAAAPTPLDDDGGSYRRLTRCVICERDYERDDLAHCPAYRGAICSLCCTLDARCEDLCKPHARLSVQWNGLMRWLLPRRAWVHIETGLGHYLLLMAVVVPLLGGLFAMLYAHELPLLLDARAGSGSAGAQALRLGFVKAFAALLLVSGIVAWWMVLTH